MDRTYLLQSISPASAGDDTQSRLRQPKRSRRRTDTDISGKSEFQSAAQRRRCHCRDGRHGEGLDGVEGGAEGGEEGVGSVNSVSYTLLHIYIQDKCQEPKSMETHIYVLILRHILPLLQMRPGTERFVDFTRQY